MEGLECGTPLPASSKSNSAQQLRAQILRELTESVKKSRELSAKLVNEATLQLRLKDILPYAREDCLARANAAMKQAKLLENPWGEEMLEKYK